MEINESVFSVKEIYKTLRGRHIVEDPAVIEACLYVSKLKIPCKVRIFAWQLLRGRLMTRVRRKRTIPEAQDDCVLCTGAVEDCSHLFFECPFARAIWASRKIPRIDVSSATQF